MAPASALNGGDERLGAPRRDEAGPRTAGVRDPPRRADGAPPPTPLVFASPHSGRLYPADMMAAAALDAQAIRRSEDAFVDDLIAGAPDLGAALITAGFARAYIDVNREAFELDPAMFADELPDFARARTARVAAGLGAIARVVSEGQEIYAPQAHLRRGARADRGGAPALSRGPGPPVGRSAGRARPGGADRLALHAGRGGAGRRARDGPATSSWATASAPPAPGVLPARVERELEAMGYRVARNTPYAGGYTTEHYGRPRAGVHALQIEINRGLYLDEATLGPPPASSGCAAISNS